MWAADQLLLAITERKLETRGEGFLCSSWDGPHIVSATHLYVTETTFTQQCSVFSRFHVQMATFWKRPPCTWGRRRHQKHSNTHSRPAVSGVILLLTKTCPCFENVAFSSSIHEDRDEGILKSCQNAVCVFTQVLCGVNCVRIWGGVVVPFFCLFVFN